MARRRRAPRATDVVAPAEWGAALAAGVASLAWNLAGGSFPPTFHPDEARLVRIVAGGPDDGSDPSLLPNLGRLAAAFAGANGPDEIAAWGRGLAALAGAIAVVLAWRLARDALPSREALFGALVLAACPLLVLPAHYFAADTLALSLGLAALLCLARMTEGRGGAWPWLFGAFAGLAGSARWGAASLLLVGAATPLACRVADRRRWGTQMAVAAAVAVLVVLLVNLPGASDPAWIAGGPWVQLRRLVEGGHVAVSGASHGFTFHLRESLLPGLTLPVLAASLAGVAVAVARRRTLPASARLAFLWAGLAWAVAEISPQKPHPDSFRSLVPALPAVALATGLAARALAERVREPARLWLEVAAMAVLLLFPLVRSGRLVAGLDDDPRTRADAFVAANAGRALREMHSSARPHDVPSLATVDLDAARRSGVTHAVASSFVYETFARGSRLSGQPDYVYERHRRYQELFQYPYAEFAPEGPSFGWSQPVIRVLDLREPRPPGRP